MRQLFEKYRPAVVFHAAAYKHVALVEANPIEAARNNTLVDPHGRRPRGRVRREALRPHLDGQGRQREGRHGQHEGALRVDRRGVGAPRRHVDAVLRRPLRERARLVGQRHPDLPQARSPRGGPVTVTHPEMTRFFMTIPEAVQLVIQAGAIGGRGQVYVLDMGEPVRIVDLAETMIRLSGKEPGTDVAIEFVGRAAGREAARGALGRHGDGHAVGARGDPARHAPADRRATGSRTSSTSSRSLVDGGETLELVGRLSSIAGAPRRNGVLRRRSGRRLDGARIRDRSSSRLRRPGRRQSSSCPPSRLYVKSALRGRRVLTVPSRPTACAPGRRPGTRRGRRPPRRRRCRSTPRRPSAAGVVGSVGPSSALWFTVGDDVARLRLREVVPPDRAAFVAVGIADRVLAVGCPGPPGCRGSPSSSRGCRAGGPR